MFGLRRIVSKTLKFERQMELQFPVVDDPIFKNMCSTKN